MAPDELSPINTPAIGWTVNTGGREWGREPDKKSEEKKKLPKKTDKSTEREVEFELPEHELDSIA